MAVSLEILLRLLSPSYKIALLFVTKRNLWVYFYCFYSSRAGVYVFLHGPQRSMAWLQSVVCKACLRTYITRILWGLVFLRVFIDYRVRVRLFFCGFVSHSFNSWTSFRVSCLLWCVSMNFVLPRWMGNMYWISA